MSVRLETIATGMSSPVALDELPDGSHRLLVADQTGIVWLVTPGATAPSQALDLRPAMVALRSGYDERGLLGLAIAPDGEHAVVYYSAPRGPGAPSGFNHESVIAEYALTRDGRLDPASARQLLRIPEPQTNHNGGDLVFGPDGSLFVSVGDGGGANDRGAGHAPEGNGQDPDSRLGSILRLQVSGDPDEPVRAPADNPFVGRAGDDLVFAKGLRNPYRMSLDEELGLIAGDVGQGGWEEIDVITSGGNYGWPVREGPACGRNADSCADVAEDGSPFEPPAVAYPNAASEGGLGSAVIGGAVYRGAAIKALSGLYVFGDWSAPGAGGGRLFAADPRHGWAWAPLGVDGRDDGVLDRYLLGIDRTGDGEIVLLVSGSSGPGGTSGALLRLAPAN